MKFTKWLNEEPHHLIGLRFLRLSIGLLIFFRFMTESKFALYLWGPNGVGDGSTSFSFGRTIGANLDKIFTNVYALYVSIILCLLGTMGFIFNRFVLVSNVLLIVFFYAFENRLYLLGDGGDNITRIMLVYLLFTTNCETKSNMRIWFHNVAICAIGGQLAIVYLVSGLMKAWGDRWVLGVALYHINQVNWFSLPNLRHMYDNPIIATLSCYFSMIYQILFPVAIFSRFRMGWILTGIFFHILIAYTMGLFTFSCVMIGLELFLIRDNEFKRVEDIFKNVSIFNYKLLKAKK